MTTGVAIAAAGVVVANPVIAPRADIRVPAVALSAGSGDPSIGMLDPAFLKAIAPAPPESTNPFSVLTQLISSLASDVTYLGRNAVVDAFVAGVTAVSAPELTASSSPYLPAPANLPAAAAALLPSEFFAPLVEVPVTLPDAVPFLTDSLVPATRDLVESLAADAGYVGNQVVAAAFAVGVAIASEPALIVGTFKALVNGNMTGALQNAVKAVIAPLNPATMIVDALWTVIDSRLAALAPVSGTSAAEPPAVPDAPVAAIPPRAPGAASAPTETARDFGGPRSLTVSLPVLSAVPLPSPAAALDAATVRSATEVPRRAGSTAPAADPTGDTAAAPRAVIGAVRDAATAAGDQIGAALQGVGDGVRKIARAQR